MRKVDELFYNQTTIIQMITTRAPLRRILKYIIKCVEECSSQVKGHGSVMMYVSKKKQLRNVIHSSNLKNFIDELGTITLGPFDGSSGAAALLRRPVVSENIDNDLAWANKRELAIQNGIRSACSIPLITAQKELLGTLDLYFSQEYKPANDLLECLELYGRLASLAVEFSTSQRFFLGEWEMDVPSLNALKCEKFTESYR